MVAVIITIAVAILLGLVLYLAMEQCPSCARRGTVRWAHQRKNGGPDLRYSNNHQFCTGCGWSGAPPAPDVSATLRDLERARADREAAEAARAAAAEAERRAAAEAEERLVDEEVTERAIVWMLKYIAVADRRHAVGEKRFLVEQIHALFPPGRHRVVERWADGVKPDSASTYEMIVSHLRGLPHERRLSLYESLSAMAESDGKSTKAEQTRLTKLRGDLRFDSVAEDAP